MMEDLLPSITSSPLKNRSFFETAKLDEFFDHTGTQPFSRHLSWSSPLLLRGVIRLSPNKMNGEDSQKSYNRFDNP